MQEDVANPSNKLESPTNRDKEGFLILVDNFDEEEDVAAGRDGFLPKTDFPGASCEDFFAVSTLDASLLTVFATFAKV